MRRFVGGLLAGVFGTLYAQMLVRDYQDIKNYNESMTELFNSVPPEQRFGYEKDFASGTKWYM